MKKENPLKNRWQLAFFGEKMEEKDYSEEWREETFARLERQQCQQCRVGQAQSKHDRQCWV